MKFLSKEKAKKFHNPELVERAYKEGSKSRDAFAMRLPVIDEGGQIPIVSLEVPITKKTVPILEEIPAHETQSNRAKREGYTGSLCGACGGVRMKQNGSCEICLDCGETSGCS